MLKTENVKAYYFFDEAGDPQVLGRKGVNLIESGKASKVFMVGYLETKSSKEIRNALIKLQQEILADEYLSMIPSVADSTAKMFHACMDCVEVREKVYKLLKTFDFDKYPKTYYSPKNPLEAKKIDPV